MFQQIQQVPKLKVTVVCMASCGMQAPWPGCELGTHRCRPGEANVAVCKSIQYHAAGAHTVPHLAHAIARPNHLSLGASFQKPKFAWSWFSKRFATSGLKEGTVPSALRTNWRRCVMPVNLCITRSQQMTNKYIRINVQKCN